MSCKNFETVITEMARGQMMDAGARENTLEHFKACQPCAARFADERALTAGLHHVASIQGSMSAPASVESALVAAFRQLGKIPVAPIAAPASRTLSRWAALGIAAAAAVLVVSVFAVSRLLFIDSARESVRQERIEKASPSSSPMVAATGGGQDSNESGALPSSPDSEPKLADIPVPPRSIDRPRGPVRNAEFIGQSIHSAVNNRRTPKASEEVVTEFLPLTYGGLSQVDDGQVVRIEVPRSALQSLGLPVNVERAGERVKADVLLGHDGVARAIRFIR